MTNEPGNSEELFETGEPPTEPSKFSAVVDAIDRGNRVEALKLLGAVETMDKSDIALLYDLLDDNPAYFTVHPYRIELKSRAGVGKPKLPALDRLEYEMALRAEVKSLERQGLNLKKAFHVVAQGLGLQDDTVRKAYQRAEQKTLFPKKKHTK